MTGIEMGGCVGETQGTLQKKDGMTGQHLGICLGPFS